MTKPIAISIEAAPKKSFATAVDWPGWSRSGKAEGLGHAALTVAGGPSHPEEDVVDGQRGHVVGRAGSPFAEAAKQIAVGVGDGVLADGLGLGIDEGVGLPALLGLVAVGVRVRVAVPVAVAVEEAADVDVVEDRAPPPRPVHRARPRRCR